MSQNALQGSQGGDHFVVGTTDSINAGGPWTIDFKFKYGSNNLNQRYSWCTSGPTRAEGNPTILFGLDVNGVFWYYNGSYHTYAIQWTWTLNTWYDIEVVYDGSRVYFFQNGIVESQAFSVGAQAGMWFASGVVNGSVAGTIDEIRFSNIARHTTNFTPSQSEFTTDANTILLYHLNEGTGTSVSDSSGNGHTGTLDAVGTFWTTGYSFVTTQAQTITGKASVSISRTKTIGGKSLVNAVNARIIGGTARISKARWFGRARPSWYEDQ